MSSKVKRYVALLLVAGSVFVSQVACDESSTPSAPKTTVISTNSGGDWRRCASLTCTYKKDGDIRTGIKGVRINLGSATPLGGKWE